MKTAEATRSRVRPRCRGQRGSRGALPLDRRPSDFLASLVLPGLTQGMYFMPRLGLAFLGSAVAAWLLA